MDCFNELDQVSFPFWQYGEADIPKYSGTPTPTLHPVLARDRIENSLTYGYYEMIGTLSKHREGVKWVAPVASFMCTEWR